MTIPEVEWPTLPEGYRWRVGRDKHPTEFGPWYSDEYYVFIEKEETRVSGLFKKTTKTEWTPILQRTVYEGAVTPAVVLSVKNIESAAQSAYDGLETLFAKRKAEDKFFGTHP